MLCRNLRTNCFASACNLFEKTCRESEGSSAGNAARVRMAITQQSAHPFPQYECTRESCVGRGPSVVSVVEANVCHFEDHAEGSGHSTVATSEEPCLLRIIPCSRECSQHVEVVRCTPPQCSNIAPSVFRLAGVGASSGGQQGLSEKAVVRCLPVPSVMSRGRGSLSLRSPLCCSSRSCRYPHLVGICCCS